MSPPPTIWRKFTPMPVLRPPIGNRQKIDDYRCSAVCHAAPDRDTCSSHEFYFTGQEFIASWVGYLVRVQEYGLSASYRCTVCATAILGFWLRIGWGQISFSCVASFSVCENANCTYHYAKIQMAGKKFWLIFGLAELSHKLKNLAKICYKHFVAKITKFG